MQLAMELMGVSEVALEHEEVVKATCGSLSSGWRTTGSPLSDLLQDLEAGHMYAPNS